MIQSNREGPAIYINKDLHIGQTHSCVTFDNKPLIEGDGFFECITFEAFVLV